MTDDRAGDSPAPNPEVEVETDPTIDARERAKEIARVLRPVIGIVAGTTVAESDSSKASDTRNRWLIGRS